MQLYRHIQQKKYKERWNGSKGRGSYNNLTGRENQQDGSSSNQIKSSNQSNHRGGATCRGRGDGRILDKSHIQCYNCQKYRNYASQCRGGKKENQESDARLIKHEEEEMLLMVIMEDKERFRDQWYLDSG